MKKFSITLAFCFLLTLFVFPLPNLSAQINQEGAFVSISISPQNPKPGEQVRASLQSFSVDLDRAKITWSVNGSDKKTEIGLKDYYVEAGMAGKIMTVGARLQASDGTTINKEVSFIPAGVDLLYEVISYTPPFYKGKALNSNQGTIVMVAFPEMFDPSGRKYSTKEVIFTWKKDGVVQGSLSGLGKNYFTFSGSVPIRNAEIEVTAVSADQTVTAHSSIVIPTGSPKIIFYENSPIYGIMTNKAIKNTVNMLVDEFSVLAVPYFFSVGYATTPDLDYVWSLNGQTVGNQELKNSFTTRIEKAGAGSANIGVKINNNVRIFQFGNADYTINFEKQ